MLLIHAKYVHDGFIYKRANLILLYLIYICKLVYIQKRYDNQWILEIKYMGKLS